MEISGKFWFLGFWDEHSALTNPFWVLQSHIKQLSVRTVPLTSTVLCVEFRDDSDRVKNSIQEQNASLFKGKEKLFMFKYSGGAAVHMCPRS